jgi:hypothetical protein
MLERQSTQINGSRNHGTVNSGHEYCGSPAGRPAACRNAAALKRPRILILADTPNLYRRSAAVGLGGRPDYDRFRRQLLTVGAVRAEAIVNGGVSTTFVKWLQVIHWVVTFSHAEDTDEMLIARAVLGHRSIDCVVIASGDGKNVELINLLKAIGKYTVVAGIRGSIHSGLYRVADQVVDFPVVISGRAAA